MDNIPQLLASLRNIEFWLNAHVNDKVAIKLNHLSYMITSRRLLLRRILRIQLREFNRD